MCVGGGGGEGEGVTGISQAFTHRRHLEGRTLEAYADLPTSRSVFISVRSDHFQRVGPARVVGRQKPLHNPSVTATRDAVPVS